MLIIIWLVNGVVWVQRKYHDAVLNDDRDAIREHLSCDELEDEEHTSPAGAKSDGAVRLKDRKRHGHHQHQHHRLSQPSPDSCFRSDVEGSLTGVVSSSLGGLSPQFHKLMSNIPLTRSYHGNLSAASSKDNGPQSITQYTLFRSSVPIVNTANPLEFENVSTLPRRSRPK